MNKKRFIALILILIILILMLITFTFLKKEKIKNIFINVERQSVKDINFEIYYNKNNLLKILVTATDTENGIKTLIYEKEDKTKVEINGNGKKKISIDYQVETDGEYEFKFVNEVGEEITKILNIDNIFRRNYLNLNQVNLNTFEANGYSGMNGPGNAIDNSMIDGNGYNWYGGTKLLIEYNTLSTITHMGVYTTDNWGYQFDSATIYYSEDDSLNLDSDLSNYKYITVKTENIEKLTEKIDAKRVMLIKQELNAVYEFECYGNPNIDTDGVVYVDKTLAYPILTKDGMKNVKCINIVNESDYTYKIDLNKKCIAEDALDPKAYDGDETTYYDPSSSQNKFYFENIDIWPVCLKIDDNAIGTIYIPSGFCAVPQEGTFIQPGIFHMTCWGKTLDFSNVPFYISGFKVYEIYYDKNLE